MSDPTFGIGITRVDNEPRPASAGDLSVAGIVGTAPLANAAVFPLNVPVLVFSADAAALTALGAGGTLPDAIRGIQGQLGEFQVSARVVVVRVAPGVDDAATMANIIGNVADKSGIHALVEAGPVLGVVPRLIGAPGYTKQHWRGLTAVTPGIQGSNLTEAPTITFAGGGTDPGKVLPSATATLGTGADAGKVVGYVITDPGKNLSGAVTIAFAGGGTDAGKVLPTATAVIEHLANPVVAALPPVLARLLGTAVVMGPSTTRQAYDDWRETIQSDAIVPVETGVKYGVDASLQDSAPRVIGLAIRRDHEKGGRPFHSWANQPIYDIVGPARPIAFSLTDGSTEGQQILANNGGIIVRGEAGVETAIASGGFIYIGTDTCAEDPLWRFYNVKRGRDYIHLMFLKTLRFYLGRFNITGQTIDAILNTMRFALRDLKANGDILGYKVGFTRDQNSPENLRLGRFTVDFAAEEPSALRYIGIRSARYHPALDSLLDDLLTQIDVAA